MNTALEFLEGNGTDHLGRKVTDYLHFTASDWDCNHDVIQWAFPTATKSAFNPHAPVLPEWFSLDKQQYPNARNNVDVLLDRYLNTLGIQFNGRGFTIDYSKAYWFGPRDHNLRRFTRILECLRLFKMDAEAIMLSDFLIYDLAFNNPNVIDTTTLAYWVAARDNKLSLLHKQ